MRLLIRALISLATIICLLLPSNLLNAANQPRHGHQSGTLVLYAAMGYDQDAAKLFEKQTGIKVNLVDDSTGPLIARVTAQRNNPQWDVIWFDGAVTMLSLDQQGYLYHYRSPNIRDYTHLGRSLLPANYTYYPTGVTAAGAIAYNKKLIGNTPLPRHWTDLLRPVYRDQLAENDPAFSGPAYPFIAGLMQELGGIHAGERFFERLKANGVKIYQTNDPTIKSVETGARKFGIVQDSAIYGEIAAGQPLGIIYPLPGVTILPSVVGIDKRAPHLQLAKRFVDWLLTKQGGQWAMTHHDLKDGDSYFKPVIEGVHGHRHDPSGIHWIRLHDTFWARHETQIKAWFHNHIVSS
jgi:iron(III) transport system substrate-binding protein